MTSTCSMAGNSPASKTTSTTLLRTATTRPLVWLGGMLVGSEEALIFSCLVGAQTRATQAAAQARQFITQIDHQACQLGIGIEGQFQLPQAPHAQQVAPAETP